jgi:hypothetical protein
MSELHAGYFSMAATTSREVGLELKMPPQVNSKYNTRKARQRRTRK